MATTEPIRPTNTIKIAEEARDELRTALTAVGIKLPPLSLDTPSITGDITRPLVTLGRCTPEVARRLAAVLRTCST
ncbi:hypothetical protein DF18_07900 [Streptomyces rimosus]|uniref:hypothetical protein n=1 Tax=Streptomyces rimosus TaxID=1927 RepID=UPI0004D8EB61|nr:hypothetical protein [Streptomyces rimosus]KEF21118.1 hypothetical protein DF18_07900 [Streptomyces rimosus]